MLLSIINSLFDQLMIVILGGHLQKSLGKVIVFDFVVPNLLPSEFFEVAAEIHCLGPHLQDLEQVKEVLEVLLREGKFLVSVQRLNSHISLPDLVSREAAREVRPLQVVNHIVVQPLPRLEAEQNLSRSLKRSSVVHSIS